MSLDVSHHWSKEELTSKLTEYTYNGARLPRLVGNKHYTRSRANQGAEDCKTSSNLTRKLIDVKEINNFHLAKINMINIMERVMSEVSKRLDHHYARLVMSRDVLASGLALIQKQPKC